MQLVVPSAVRAAVAAAMTMRRMTSQRFFFIDHLLSLTVSATTVVVGLRSQDVGDRGLLLETTLLAVDRTDLTLDDVTVLEDALLLEGSAGELLALGVLGNEVDLDAVDHGIGTGCHGRLDVVLALLLTIDAR